MTTPSFQPSLLSAARRAGAPARLALLLVLAFCAVVLATPPTRAADAPPAYRELRWANLVPMGWDPMKKFRALNLDRLSDANPRMLELMDEMREVFDNAPLVDNLDGAAVRLPGYVVPLQSGKEGLTEFLLVPYFGACLHTPPPPANQIVHVRLAAPAPRLKAMDTVWASGVLKVERQNNAEMGVSGYRLDAALAAPYKAPAR